MLSHTDGVESFLCKDPRKQNTVHSIREGCLEEANCEPKVRGGMWTRIGEEGGRLSSREAWSQCASREWSGIPTGAELRMG